MPRRRALGILSRRLLRASHEIHDVSSWVEAGLDPDEERELRITEEYLDNAVARLRSWRKVAECLLGPLLWSAGEGPYASVSHCRGRRDRTAQLYASREKAAAALTLANRTGCGGRCSGRHELVDLRETRGPSC